MPRPSFTHWFVAALVLGGACAGVFVAMPPPVSHEPSDRPDRRDTMSADSDGVPLAATAGRRFDARVVEGDVPSSAVDVLTRRLRASDRAERGDALVRLRTLGPRGAPASTRVLDIFREGDDDLSQLAMLALASFGAEGVREIDRALDDVDVRVRAGAIRTLEHIAPLSLVAEGALMRGLVDPDDSVRAAAILSWSTHPDLAGVRIDDIVSRLDDPSPRVRAAAALSLGRQQGDAAFAAPALAALVGRRGEQDGPRLEAVWALARLGSAAAPASIALAEAVAFDDSPVAREAARALALIGPGALDAVPILLDASERAGEPIRSRAVAALAAIAPERPDVAERLRRRIRRGDPIAEVAVSALVTGGDEGRTAIRRACEDAEAIAAIADSTVRFDQGPAGEPTRTGLEALLEDPIDALSSLAARSLAAGGDRAIASVPMLVRALARGAPSRWASIADALGEIGVASDPVLDQLLRVAREGDPKVRATAMRSLGLVGLARPDVNELLDTVAMGADAELASVARRARSRIRGVAAAK